MRTLYVTRGNNIIIDPDTNEVDKLVSDRAAIDYIYLIDKPVHVVYGKGDKRVEADADKGDIVITFYENVFDKQMIVIKNEDWMNNILGYRKKLQEEKERWASKKDSVTECESCENCKAYEKD